MGGGQIKPQDLGLGVAETLEKLDTIMHQNLTLLDPIECESIKSLYNKLSEEEIKAMVHIEFKALEMETKISNLNW